MFFAIIDFCGMFFEYDITGSFSATLANSPKRNKSNRLFKGTVAAFRSLAPKSVSERTAETDARR